MKRELQLSDICSYLPYGLKVKSVHNRIFEIAPETIMVGAATRTLPLYKAMDGSFQPILLPMSLLTSEITHKGDTFVPLIEIAKMVFPKAVEWKMVDGVARAWQETYPINVRFEQLYCCTYDIFDKLSEWMFDYRSLIDDGLAISVTDIKEGVYE